MERRLLLGIAAVSVIGAAAFVVFLLLRRRGEHGPAETEWAPHYAPPVSAIAGEFVADEPLARSTDGAQAPQSRYDEELDAEEEQRHAAAERLKADPFDERLHDTD